MKNYYIETRYYADDFVPERKSIASLDRFDRFQFQVNSVFFPMN